jgi:hypothetical protein
MHHTTVSGIRTARDAEAVTQPRVADTATYQSVRDELLAQLLPASWPPATDGTLLAGVQPQPLGKADLIKFSVDDYITTDYRRQVAKSASPEDTR